MDLAPRAHKFFLYKKPYEDLCNKLRNHHIYSYHFFMHISAFTGSLLEITQISRFLVC